MNLTEFKEIDVDYILHPSPGQFKFGVVFRFKHWKWMDKMLRLSPLRLTDCLFRRLDTNARIPASCKKLCELRECRWGGVKS